MTDSLYTAIGGQEAIRSVVQDFYQMVYYDHQLQGYFDETDMDALRAHQTEFLSMVTGGPTNYSGRDMQAAHAGLTISKQDFDLVVTYLERALQQNDVAETHRAEILSTVAVYKDAIVNQ